MIYYCVLFFLFLCGIVEVLTDNKAKTALMAVSFVVFVILAGLKFEVGTDYASYARIYNLARWYSFNPQFGVEIFYWYWMRLFILGGAGFVSFWLITVIINIAIKYYIFNKLSPYFFASMMIYFVGLFFERDFDGLRQGIGIGICYLGITPLLNKQYGLYYLLVFIAFNFHTTCIVFALLPLVQKIDLTPKVVISLLLIAVLLVVLKIDYTEMLISYLPESFMKARLDTYISDGDELFTKNTGLSMGIIFRIVIFGMFYFYGSKLIPNEELYKLYRNGFLIAILFSLLFNNIDIIGHRFAYGLREFQILIIPSFMLITENKWKKILILSLIFSYSLFLLFRLLNTEHLAPYYNYKNILLLFYTN